jgi:hypothetical protein
MSEDIWWYILYGWLGIIGILFLYVLIRSEFDYHNFHNDDRF